MKRMAEHHAAWTARLPEDEAALWDWLLAQDTATLTALLAYCVASAVKPEQGASADRLASAVALDMAQWWQPTVAGYLGRVPKPLILAAVTEAKGIQAADNIARLKKGDMASHIVSRSLIVKRMAPALKAGASFARGRGREAETAPRRGCSLSRPLCGVFVMLWNNESLRQLLCFRAVLE